MGEKPILAEMIEVCRRLHQRDLLAAADGNVSYRISDNRILITPSGVHKAFMKPEEMAVINLQNEIIEGTPSSERLMHLGIYRECPQARCVIHAHPPTATAWTLARPELHHLPSEAMPEITLAVGQIPIVPYARPSTIAMADNLLPFLPQNRVMILARHGAVVWGESLVEAYNGMERLEHVAKILASASSLGGISELPPQELSELKLLRAKRGERSL